MYKYWHFSKIVIILNLSNNNINYNIIYSNNNNINYLNKTLIFNSNNTNNTLKNTFLITLTQIFLCEYKSEIKYFGTNRTQ